MSKMIDGNALIMSLTDWWYSSFGQEETEESKAIKTVVDEVEKYVDGYPTYREWIPVRERLPEKETIYLCTFESGTVSMSSWHKTTQYNNGFDNVVHGINMLDEHDNTIYSYGVTAWMPLPEPYKEGES